jgi:murein DD-endopeptidase MepM/ murein hydrolase activator NlpD
MSFWSYIVSRYREIIGSLSETPVSKWSDWVWPMPELNGNQPEISDGFGADKRDKRGHFGLDITHRRRKNENYEETANLEGKTHRLYVIYKDEMALSGGPGKVYATEITKTGHTVKISHKVEGRPILSVYRHLRNFAPGIKAGAIILAGSPLGMIGDNPAEVGDPPHLHFELWDTSLNNVALKEEMAARGSKKGGDYLKWIFDPATVMKPWKVIRWEDRKPNTYDGPRIVPGDTPGTVKGDRNGGLIAFLGLGTILLLGLFKSRRNYV